MKITPKKNSINKIQEKVGNIVDNKSNPVVNNSQEYDSFSEAVNTWQSQNTISSKVLDDSEKELSQITDTLTDNSVPNRVVDLLSNQVDVSVKNTDVSDVINPFMPVVHVKSLPSKFIPYKLLTNKPEIVFKPYKYGEIKKMNQSKMSVKQLFVEVLQGIECNFDKELLTLSDFTFIGLLRRVSTLRSAKFNANFTCSSCGSTNKQEFDNSKLDFQDLSCDLPITVEFDNKDYSFTPLTIKDYLLLYDLDKLDDQIAFFAVQCRNTDIVINYPSVDKNGVKLTTEQRRFYTIYNIFYNLTSSEDGEVLDMLDTYLDHKLKPIQLTCTGIVEFTDEEGILRQSPCNNPISVTLDGGGVLITPFRESDEPVKSRFRFGS